MLSRFPHLSGFFSKVFYELLPAAIASAVGGVLFNHYAKLPTAPPQVTVQSPASAEMLQMVRDEHVLMVEYVKKQAEARQQAGRAAEHDARRIEAAEQAATQALREARAAEARAHALAARIAATAAETSQKREAAKQPDRAPAIEPLPPPQVASVAAPVQPPVPAASTAHSDDNAVIATVRRIPSLFRSAADWFADDAPPRPPASLPGRNFVNAAM